MLVTTRYIELTDDNFKSEVLETQVPVLVDCWANWCGSFHTINPLIEALAIEFEQHIKIARLNVATAERLTAQFGIRAVPTLLLFQEGQVLERVIGSVSKQRFSHRLNALLTDSRSSRGRIAWL